jgi:cytoskeletal protein CcmA (bactofilin family)
MDNYNARVAKSAPRNQDEVMALMPRWLEQADPNGGLPWFKIVILGLGAAALVGASAYAVDHVEHKDKPNFKNDGTKITYSEPSHVNTTWNGHVNDDVNWTWNGNLDGTFTNTTVSGSVNGDVNSWLNGTLEGKAIGYVNLTSFDGTMDGKVTNLSINASLDALLDNVTVDADFQNASVNANLTGAYSGRMENVTYNGRMVMTGADFKKFWRNLTFEGTGTMNYGNGPVNFNETSKVNVSVINDTETVELNLEGRLSTGYLNGTFNGSASGTLFGKLKGALTGAVKGKVTGSVSDGDYSGRFRGSATGTAELDLDGKVTGDVKGKIENGNFDGKVTGEFDGSLLGNVIGKLEAYLSGWLDGDIETEKTVPVALHAAEAAALAGSAATLAGVAVRGNRRAQLREFLLQEQHGFNSPGAYKDIVNGDFEGSRMTREAYMKKWGIKDDDNN